MKKATISETTTAPKIQAIAIPAIVPPEGF
jgi:hypothetical protein